MRADFAQAGQRIVDGEKAIRHMVGHGRLLEWHTYAALHPTASHVPLGAPGLVRRKAEAFPLCADGRVSLFWLTLAKFLDVFMKKVKRPDEPSGREA